MKATIKPVDTDRAMKIFDQILEEDKENLEVLVERERERQANASQDPVSN